MVLRLGLVGTGIISTAYAKAIKENPGKLQLTAVCNRSERAIQIVNEFGLGRYMNDFHAFPFEAPVDAVAICLPHVLHYPAAKAALNAGKHVLVEKPFVTSLAEAVELVDLAESRNLTLMVAQSLRFRNEIACLKRYLESGVLGKILHCRIDCLQNLKNYILPPHWLYDGSVAGGGCVISIGVHFIDLMRYLVGEIASVSAVTRTTSPEFINAEDYCTALLEYQNGAIGELFSTYSAPALPYAGMFWLFGERGVIHTIPPKGVIEDLTPQLGLWSRPRGPNDFSPIDCSDRLLPSDSSIENELLHFADCIDRGLSPLTSGRDNLGTMKVIDAIYRSAGSAGQRICINEP